jgi:Homeobox associated leucine zipper
MKNPPKDLKEAVGDGLTNATKIENPNGGLAFTCVNAETAIDVLAYYSYEARGFERRTQAKQNHRTMSKAGAKLFVYAKAGYQLGAADDAALEASRKVAIQDTLAAVSFRDTVLAPWAASNPRSVSILAEISPEMTGLATYQPPLVQSTPMLQTTDTSALEQRLRLQQDTISNQALNLNRQGLAFNKYMKLVEQYQNGLLTPEALKMRNALSELHFEMETRERDFNLLKAECTAVKARNRELDKENERLQCEAGSLRSALGRLEREARGESNGIYLPSSN